MIAVVGFFVSPEAIKDSGQIQTAGIGVLEVVLICLLCIVGWPIYKNVIITEIKGKIKSVIKIAKALQSRIQKFRAQYKQEQKRTLDELVKEARVLVKALIVPVNHYGNELRSLEDILDVGMKKIDGMKEAMEVIIRKDEEINEAYRKTRDEVHKVKMVAERALDNYEEKSMTFGDKSFLWKLANINRIYTFLNEMEAEKSFCKTGLILLMRRLES